MDDLNTLINHYTVKSLSEKEIEDLRESAQKFINSDDLDDEEKLSVLYSLKDILEESEQSSIGINDETAR